MKLLHVIATALLALGMAACGGASKIGDATHRGSDATSTARGDAGGSTQSTSPQSDVGATITTSYIPPKQPFRGDGDADNPSDIDGNGDIDTRTTAEDKATSDDDSDGPVPASYRYPDSDDQAVLSYGRIPPEPEKRAISSLVMRYYAAAVRQDGKAACSMIVPELSRSVVQDYGSGAGPSYLRASTCGSVMDKLFAHEHEQLTSAVAVLAVRVSKLNGQVIVASRAMPASHILVERSHGSWGISAIFSTPLP